jgi:hypothetical protein
MPRITASLDDRADRLFFSLVGGFILPQVCFWLAWLVLEIRQAVTGRDSTSFNNLVAFPIYWPYRVFLHYFPPDPKVPFDVGFAFYDPRNLLMMVVGNFVLYTIVSYGILTYVQICRREIVPSPQLT